MNSGGPKQGLTWQEKVAKKRALQAEALAAVHNGALSSTVEPQIGALTKISSASAVVDRIVSGEATSQAVTEAFIKRAFEAHQLTNCLTEVTFHEALKQAQELDDYFKRHGKPVGPLHGVAVTLKDQFNLKSIDTTLGYVGRSFDPALEDAVLVKILKSLGAVIIAKSNLPQSILWCETENPLWGLTTNPTRKEYTPGGSSGGESAVLACQASVLGWGTDIGGSIRIPSHMMGLYGLKPSSARLPYRGVEVSTDGQEHVPSAVGPMGRSMDTLHLAMKAVLEAQPWKFDARCSPIPWRQDLYDEVQGRPLVVGILLDDEVVRPHPPISRVMNETIKVLRDAGHEIVEWNAQYHAECVEVMDKFYTVDGGQDIRDAILAGGEPLIPRVQQLLDDAQPISVYDYWQLNKRKWDLQQKYIDKWNSIRSPRTGSQVDVILMPAMPHSAVPHRGCRWVGYTKVWNVLDYSALVIPGGSVVQEDVNTPWDYEARGPLDEWTKRLWEERRSEMASSKLPVGVQLVCQKLEEEKLLAVGKIVDDLLRVN